MVEKGAASYVSVLSMVEAEGGGEEKDFCRSQRKKEQRVVLLFYLGRGKIRAACFDTFLPTSAEKEQRVLVLFYLGRRKKEHRVLILL